MSKRNGRRAEISRQTKETKVEVALDLDGSWKVRAPYRHWFF